MVPPDSVSMWWMRHLSSGIMPSESEFTRFGSWVPPKGTGGSGAAPLGGVEQHLPGRVLAGPVAVLGAEQHPSARVAGGPGRVQVEGVVVVLGAPEVADLVAVGVDDLVEVPPVRLLARGCREGRL